MGICSAHALFSEHLPSLEELRQQVAQRSGLAVGLTAEGPDRGRLFFACVPKEGINVERNTPEKIQQAAAIVDEMGLKGLFPSSSDSRTSIRLQTYVGLEPTLFFQACQALAELGGELVRLTPEEPVQEWLRPLTESELHMRVRRAHRQAFWMSLLIMPMLMVLVPFWLVMAFWNLIAVRPMDRYRGILRDMQAAEGDQKIARSDRTPGRTP
jgi:hypothetical protein